MPTATTADVRLVAAWIATPSCKQAAHSLGMTEAAYRHRLSRLYRRWGVRNMATLIHVMGPDAAQMARLAADDADVTLAS